MKFTLKCEQPVFNDYTGKQTGFGRTITHEFTDVDLREVLDNLEMFLRGAGFYFTGRLEICDDVTDKEIEQINNLNIDLNALNTSSDVMQNMVNDLLKNAHIQPINLEGDEHNELVIKNCSVCGLPDTVMKNQICWDSKCPKMAHN